MAEYALGTIWLRRSTQLLYSADAMPTITDVEPCTDLCVIVVEMGLGVSEAGSSVAI